MVVRIRDIASFYVRSRSIGSSRDDMCTLQYLVERLCGRGSSGNRCAMPAGRGQQRRNAQDPFNHLQIDLYHTIEPGKGVQFTKLLGFCTPTRPHNRPLGRRGCVGRSN